MSEQGEIDSLRPETLDEAIRRIGSTIAVLVGEVVAAAERDPKIPSLLNHTAFLRYGEQFLLTARENPGFVVYGDLNSFRAFNDRYGHDEADIALIKAGNRFAEVVRAHEGQGFHRSGDEFLALVPAGGSSPLTDALHESFSAMPVTLRGAPAIVRMSFGGAFATRDRTLAELVRRAEEACTLAKQQADGLLLTWDDDTAAKLGTKARDRCKKCRSEVVLTIPQDQARQSTFACPVCGGPIMDAPIAAAHAPP